MAATGVRQRAMQWLGIGYFAGALIDCAVRSDIFVLRVNGPRTLYPFEFSRSTIAGPFGQFLDYMESVQSFVWPLLLLIDLI